MQSIQDIYRELNRFIFQKQKERKKKIYGIKVSLNGIDVTIKDFA